MKDVFIFAAKCIISPSVFDNTGGESSKDFGES